MATQYGKEGAKIKKYIFKTKRYYLTNKMYYALFYSQAVIKNPVTYEMMKKEVNI
jgi:hypothetical protein